MPLDEAMLREYYSMPDGEVPYNVYEDRKVHELSERIRSHEGSAKSSNVHIISGRKQEQVRRIAFLTAMKLLKTGVDVVPVSSLSEFDEPLVKGSSPVFLIDEEQVRNHLEEGENFDPEKVRQVMRHVRRNYRKNHSVFLSIGQDTYESKFRDNINDVSDERSSEKTNHRKMSSHAGRNKKNSSTRWYAFLFPALSFLISPVNQYFVANGDPFQLNTPGFSVFQNFIYPALFVTPVLLSMTGLVLLSASWFNRNEKGTKLLRIGTVLFLLEIIIPFILLVMGIVPSSVAAGFLVPALLFVIFQSVAVASFMIIPFSFSSRIEKLGLSFSFGITEVFVLAVFMSYHSIPLLLPIIPASVLVTIPPYMAPFNTIFFGLSFAHSLYLSYVVILFSYISQAAFGVVYLIIALHQRIGFPELPWADEHASPEHA